MSLLVWISSLFKTGWWQNLHFEFEKEEMNSLIHMLLKTNSYVNENYDYSCHLGGILAGLKLL